MTSSHTTQVADLSWKADKCQFEDFVTRWRAARLSALSSVMGERVVSEASALLQLCEGSDDVRKAALKAVFYVGGFFASGMTRHFQRLWEIEDAIALLSVAELPYFKGQWHRPEGLQSYYLSQSTCELATKPFLCEYWKEAVDGFITGLSDRFFFSRHRSIAGGDSECLDWVYTRAESYLKFGSLPDEIAAATSEIIEHLKKSKVRFEAAGYAEQTLYYRMESDENSLCGPGKKLFEEYVKSKLKCISPELKMFDISPRAVLQEGA